MRKIKRAIIIGITTLIAVVIVLAFLGDRLAFLSVFTTDALWASVIVLVIVNISEIISGGLQTRYTLKELEKARKADFLPYIRFKLAWTSGLVLKASNSGKGPALKIDAEITYSPNCKRSWTESIFAEKEAIEFLPPELEIVRLLPEKFPQIEVKGKYEDIFGQEYPISEVINTKQFMDETIALQLNLGSNGVAKEIAIVGKELNKISSHINDLKPKTTDFPKKDTNAQNAAIALTRMNSTLAKIEAVLESIDCKVHSRPY